MARRKFTREFKISAVQLVNQQGYSISQAAKSLGVDPNCVRGWVEPNVADDGTATYRTERHGDAFGHGTACAGIIHRIAPDAEIYSVRVLGPRLSGKGPVFAAGVRWAAENGMHVVNLSLGTTKRDFFGLFHDIADTAYHRGVTLVTAANNMPEPSFPSLFAAVLSVACHAEARGDESERDALIYGRIENFDELG